MRLTWYDDAVSVSYVGSDVLSAPYDPPAVPGLDALQNPKASAPAAPATTATQNPYQQTYDSLQQWSANYLMQAVMSGPPALPEFTAGQSIDAFAQFTTALGALSAAGKIDTTA